MAEPYLRELKAIVERASAPREEAVDVSCKHFFSGAAAYADGHIFMTLTAVGLALKLPEDDRNTLFGRGAKALRYFPRAPVKKDYVLLSIHLVDDDGALNGWISRSIEFVRR
jgi:TfoX/Sxy family transcriptional regulator of competence genes